MSDMYGAVRSNVFMVRDPAAFRDWFAQYRFGDDIELWQEGDAFAFGGYEQYPSAHPKVDIGEGEDAGEWRHVDDANLDQFAAEMRQHLQDGEVFLVVAAGHEKLRYVAYSEMIVRQDHDTPVFVARGSDDLREAVIARHAGHLRDNETA